MKKVMVAYYSRAGKTEQMAEAIAEGVRFSGNAAEVVKIADIKSEKDLQGFDGYIFDTMEHVFKMQMTDLGPVQAQGNERDNDGRDARLSGLWPGHREEAGRKQVGIMKKEASHV